MLRSNTPTIVVSDYADTTAAPGSIKLQHRPSRSTFGFYTGRQYDQLEPSFPLPPIKRNTPRSKWICPAWAWAIIAALFISLLAWLATIAYSTKQRHYYYTHRNQSNIDVFDTWSIQNSEMKASFIGLGASLTNLWVKNSTGQFVDVVLGYDDRTQYLEDPKFAYFGSVVGRYANRIKNGTFSIPPNRFLPPDAQAPSLPPTTRVYHTTTNEHYGANTLHGGQWGYSRAGWSLVKHDRDSVEFGLLDKDGTEGFPGEVYTTVTYAISLSQPGNRPRLTTTMRSTVAPGYETPIMLSSHVYFNLDGYQAPPSRTGINVDAALSHRLQMRSDSWIKVDGILVPSGDFGSVGDGGSLASSMDFRNERSIGERWDMARDGCGPGCTGYDTAFLLDPARSDRADAVASLSSPLSGIRMLLRTTETTLQLYTCTGLDALIPRKRVHGGPELGYGPRSCVVLEPEGKIGGIREPQWGEDQMYDEHRPYEWWSEYEFSVDR